MLSPDVIKLSGVHSGVQSVPKCQPTSGLAAMLKATKISETNMSEYERDPQKAL